MIDLDKELRFCLCCKYSVYDKEHYTNNNQVICKECLDFIKKENWKKK